MAKSKLELRFDQAMVGIYQTSKRELGYNATRFFQMILDQGGLATARQLLWSETPSDGFTTLWQHHRLDLSVEALVLLREFAPLFSDDDHTQARRRLESYDWHPNNAEDYILALSLRATTWQVSRVLLRDVPKSLCSISQSGPWCVANTGCQPVDPRGRLN